MLLSKKNILLCLGFSCGFAQAIASTPLQEAMALEYLQIGLSSEEVDSAKLGIIEAYSNTGDWVNSNAEAAMMTPESYANSVLQSLTVSTGGQIILTFTEKSGLSGGEIRLQPSLVNNVVEWNCTTADYPNIQIADSQCQYENNNAKSMLSQGLVLSTSVRQQISEDYSVTGQLPNNNQSAGLLAPSSYADEVLQAISISEGGVITLQYQPEPLTMKSGRILLVPEVQNNFSILWKCVSPDYVFIGKFFSNCSYADPIVVGMLHLDELKKESAMIMLTVASIKQNIVEAIDYGIDPKSNQSIGLPAPASYATDLISNLSVIKGGVIVLKLTEKSGVKDGVITISPNIQDDSWVAGWRCTTTDYPHIELFMPMCSYQ